MKASVAAFCTSMSQRRLSNSKLKVSFNPENQARRGVEGLDQAVLGRHQVLC